VGDHTKAEVRELARKFNLPVAERADSQDLCFIADKDYHRFLNDHAPGVARPGPIVDRAGRVLGEHKGLPFYTIGQRKGIGIAAPEAYYVLGADPERNALIVGFESELGQTTMRVGRVNWVSGIAPRETFTAGIKIRYQATERRGTVTPIGNDRAGVALDEPMRDITPGQAAVFYDGEVCLGGGIILR
jgi:tRNA-specific 2-thiouridylase